MASGVNHSAWSSVFYGICTCFCIMCCDGMLIFGGILWWIYPDCLGYQKISLMTVYYFLNARKHNKEPKPCASLRRAVYRPEIGFNGFMGDHYKYMNIKPNMTVWCNGWQNGRYIRLCSNLRDFFNGVRVSIQTLNVCSEIHWSYRLRDKPGKNPYTSMK